MSRVHTQFNNQNSSTDYNHNLTNISTSKSFLTPIIFSLTFTSKTVIEKSYFRFLKTKPQNCKKLKFKTKVNNSGLFVSCRESRIEHARSLYGSFYLGPFSAEQSLTVANALRRTLLSELKGLAITSVEIEGATHEYSTLVGIKDSVLDILLNLKEVILKSQFTFKKTQFAYLKIIGPGVVRAKDLKLPTFIQSVDPNQYIATLADNGVLNMKIKIEQGKNYLIQKPVNLKTSLNSISKEILIKKLLNLKKQFNHPKVEKPNFKEQYFSELSLKKNLLIHKSSYPLFIDAVFMPIQKVNYVIEVDHENTNYRFPGLNQNTDNIITKSTTLQKNSTSLNHKIILEIWTNGSIHPREAISYAFKTLVSTFLNLEKAKIINSFAFKSLLNNQSVINSIYFENFNYSEVLKQLSKKSNSFVNISTKKLRTVDAKSTNDIRHKLIRKLNSTTNQLTLLTETDKHKIYLRDIGTLNISLRPYTCLKRSNINTIQELINYSKEELLLLKNFGKKSLREVEESLIQVGLQLKN